MTQLKRKRKSVCGFIVIISVALFVLGFGTYASADQNARCRQAVVNYEGYLEAAMRENKECVELLTSELNKMKKSAKQYEKNPRQMARFMKDERISPEEAEKIQKMFDKVIAIRKGYDDIKSNARVCKNKLKELLNPRIAELNRNCK